MANPKAQAAKDKGNEAFKKGDYPKAIGHYTDAIISDRNDPTYPLNRAAAYLKLGKNEDAERDCITVLGLSATNVKALFRRGQARTGMGRLIEAQRDFTEALRLEPANGAVKGELKNVAGLIEKEKQKRTRGSAASVLTSLEPEVAEKRRRIPIKIVEPSSTDKKSTSSKPPTPPQKALASVAPPARASPDTLEPVSSRPLKSSPSNIDKPTSPIPSKPSSSTTSPPASVTPPTSKPTSFKDAKQSRDSAKPSRVGGGIFRSSGNNTLFTPRDGSSSPQSNAPTQERGPSPPNVVEPTETKETKAVEKQSIPASQPEETTPLQQSRPAAEKRPLKAPASLFDFIRELSFMQSNDEKWELIRTIPPEKLPALCKSSLEPSMLVNILEVFLGMLNEHGMTGDLIQKIKEYMESIARIPRFPTISMFLSSKEKTIAAQIFNKVGIEYPPGPWTSVVGRGRPQ